MTGSRYEVDSSGYGNLQERDPLGANTGITDPYQPPAEDPVNPKYSGLVQPEQSLFLDGGGDPFNPKGGCELDGMPTDCNRLQQLADNGGVGVDIIKGGRLIGHVSLTGGALSSSGGRVAVNLPDIYYDVAQDFGDGNGVQPYPHIQAGDTYFVEVAVNTSATNVSQRLSQSDKGGMNKCERELAGTFTDNPKAEFVDVTDGDGYDHIQKADRTPENLNSDEHNHLYNPLENPKAFSRVYIPAGGRILGTGSLGDPKVESPQNWMTVYYKELNGVKDVVLQLWHVENYNGKGGTREGDRILVGQMGENGSYRYGNRFGDPTGWHVHIQAFTWWGDKDKKGNPIGDKLGSVNGTKAKRNKDAKKYHRLKLSTLFCP